MRAIYPAIGFPLLGLTLLLGFLGCQELSGEAGASCRNRGDCSTGLKCSDGLCYNPETAFQAAEELAKRTQKVRLSESASEGTMTCQKSKECKTQGRCGASLAGGCVPTLPSHCQTATIACGRKKRCTYVPNQETCCLDATGQVCNPRLGDQVQVKKTPKKPLSPTPSPP